MIHERLFSAGREGKLLHLPVEDFSHSCSVSWRREIFSQQKCFAEKPEIQVSVQ